MQNRSDKTEGQQQLLGTPAARGEGSGVEATERSEPAAVAARVRVRRPERKQLSMLPQCLDDRLAQNHPARVVVQVVERLDRAEFDQPIKAREGVAGRDGTEPSLLVALWLYATIRGIGSGRELARRCEESTPFQWLCGGVSVNHRLLSDFRSGHEKALDRLFTQVVVTLVDQGVVKVSRISQDGVRVRVGAGAASFRSEERLQQLIAEVEQHIAELKRQMEAPAYGDKAKAQRAQAEKRRAEEKLERLNQAMGQMPEIKQRLEEAAKKAGQGKAGEKIRNKKPRASTTDADARVMKMANGGFNPAANVQLATDTGSRAIVGVQVSYEGSDSAHLSAPMREEVEQRTGGKVKEHLLDGGYLNFDDLEQAHQQNVAVFVPPKPARKEKNRGHELDPKRGDSEAMLAWKQRMGSEEGKEIYKQRAATSETVNADLRRNRGLQQILVRGKAKGLCVALWCALAYNLVHFSSVLLK
jgi:transposase